MFEQFFPFPAIPVALGGLVVVAALIAREVKHYRFKKACEEIDTASPPAVLAG